MHAQGLFPGGGAAEPFGGVANVVDHFLLTEDGAHVGGKTGFVIEEHAVEGDEAHRHQCGGGDGVFKEMFLAEQHDRSLMAF